MSQPSHGAGQPPIAVIRIIHLEDNTADGELIQSMLETGGIASTIHRVETPADFEAALNQGRFDLIIWDHTLPCCNGLAASGLARHKHSELPLLFVSGTIVEALSRCSLKQGRADI